MRLSPHLGLAAQRELEENMGKKRYQVESDFEDLRGNSDPVDLDVDLNDTDNPIIQAALNGSEDYQPPEDDEDKDGDKEDDEIFIDDDEEDDDLDELDGDEDGDKSEDGDEEEDEDEDEDADEDEDEDEDDDDKYSKNVRKRIDRERDLRLSSEATSNRRIAKLERTISLSSAQSKFREEQAEAEAKLRTLRKKKKDALDEDDTDSVVDIDDQMLDIKADRKAKQIELKRLEDSIDDEVEDQGTDTPPAGQKWLDKYPQFHTNKQFQNVVLQADKMVAARGLDKNLDKYYEEMEKILAPQFPEIIKIAKKTTKRKNTQKTARKKKRSAVGSTTKAGTRRSKTKRGVIRLTKKDQEQMEVFGMDPKNANDIRAWAESKGS